jgi:hypothetical protein
MQSSRAAGAALVVFSLAAFVGASGYAFRSVGAASAAPSGPEVTGGSQPYLSFTGTAKGAVSGDPNPVTIYTVPSDRVFILTGACINAVNSNSTGYLDIAENANVKVPGRSQAAYCGLDSGTHYAGFLARGAGHVPFAPGSQVRLIWSDNTNSSAIQTATYVLEGYLAHP